MTYFLTFLWAIPSVPLWFMNIEAWVVIHALKGGIEPIGLALAAAAGQLVSFLLLYVFGHRILTKWRKLKEKVDRFDVGKFRTSGTFMLVTGASVGFPPHTVLSILAGSLKYNLIAFGCISAVGRVLRFFFLAYSPDVFRDIFGWSGAG